MAMHMLTVPVRLIETTLFLALMVLSGCSSSRSGRRQTQMLDASASLDSASAVSISAVSTGTGVATTTTIASGSTADNATATLTVASVFTSTNTVTFSCILPCIATVTPDAGTATVSTVDASTVTQDASTSSDSEDEVGCPTGNSGCACYGDSTCNDGLLCGLPRRICT